MGEWDERVGVREWGSGRVGEWDEGVREWESGGMG